MPPLSGNTRSFKLCAFWNLFSVSWCSHLLHCLFSILGSILWPALHCSVLSHPDLYNLSPSTGLISSFSLPSPPDRVKWNGCMTSHLIIVFHFLICMYRGVQRTPCGSWLSPFTIWVHPRNWSQVTRFSSQHLCLPSYLASPAFFFFFNSVNCFSKIFPSTGGRILVITKFACTRWGDILEDGYYTATTVCSLRTLPRLFILEKCGSMKMKFQGDSFAGAY